MNLDFGFFNTWLFESIHHRLPQLQDQITQHIQPQILTIAAYVQETTIYFLQFLMQNVHITCIINSAALVGVVVGDINNAIATFLNQILS